MSLFSNGMSPADIAAITGNNNDGFGGNNGWWIIFILLMCNGGWGNGFGGGFNGYGNAMLGTDFPWLINGQNGINANTNAGFQNAMLNDNITSIKDSINNIGTQLCNGFSNIETAANARQIADMQNSFALQSQMSNCCCENRLATANLGSDIAREACATRTNDTQNTQAILNAINNGIQSVKDQMCNDKIDSKNEKIAELQSQLNISNQNLLISQGFANEVDQLYNRLSNCPVPSTPVYGRTPIFSCSNGNCACGM